MLPLDQRNAYLNPYQLFFFPETIPHLWSNCYHPSHVDMPSASRCIVVTRVQNCKQNPKLWSATREVSFAWETQAAIFNIIMLPNYTVLIRNCLITRLSSGMLHCVTLGGSVFPRLRAWPPPVTRHILSKPLYTQEGTVPPVTPCYADSISGSLWLSPWWRSGASSANSRQLHVEWNRADVEVCDQMKNKIQKRRRGVHICLLREKLSFF